MTRPQHLLAVGLALVVVAAAVIAIAHRRLPTSAASTAEAGPAEVASGGAANIPSPLSGSGAMPHFSTQIKRVGPKAFSIDGSVVVPDGNAASVISELEPAAREGDSHAALLIFLKLAECRSALEREGDYNALLLDSQVMGGLDAAERRQAESLAKCEGLTPEDYQRSGQWLDMSAAGGNVIAQLMYARSPEHVIGPPSAMLKEPQRIVDYKAQAMAYLQQAAWNGSVEALDDLGDAYRSGILTRQDPIRAYAYFLASYKADSRIKPWAMEQLEASLTSDERNESIHAAKEIYRECCEPK